MSSSRLAQGLPMFRPLQRLLSRATLACALGAMVLALAIPARAEEEQALIDRARITVEGFTAQTDMVEMRRLLAKARGVFVAPQLLKAGFIIGGEGGSGLLLARNTQTDEWSPPAFYAMGAGSIGLQIGGEVSELMLVIMTQRGLEAILKNEFKAGADASIAIGPIGKGIEAGSTTDLNTDIYAFSRSQGLFGGVSLEGAVITARYSRNQSYYGKNVPSRDIVLGNAVDGRGTLGLRQALKAAEQR